MVMSVVLRTVSDSVSTYSTKRCSTGFVHTTWLDFDSLYTFARCRITKICTSKKTQIFLRKWMVFNMTSVSWYSNTGVTLCIWNYKQHIFWGDTLRLWSGLSHHKETNRQGCRRMAAMICEMTEMKKRETKTRRWANSLHSKFKNYYKASIHRKAVAIRRVTSRTVSAIIEWSWHPRSNTWVSNHQTLAIT